MDAGKAKVGSTNGLFKPPATRLARGRYPYFCIVSARQSRADA